MDAKSSSQISKTIAEASRTIPAHIVERLESEWRQMRQPSAPSAPATK
ncbi:hypothetical protein ACQZ4R_09005 [Agrobacterium vitis]|nr:MULTISPECIES: hypothetical protein [Rhizobium/Agrobacterium group]MCM2449909.1 hypothetical protein [Agrobacterium vitis]MCM2470113.1 hypothetical protein [Agrobacterium vitis]NSX95386.1 hypothetical protein [Agrobacterium vitis]NSZ26526.1 hypothetical protein [Agrobacterium vitis]UJL76580.1 hypothetical protein AVCG678_03120 [Agrobacterium vitis]